MRRNLAKQYVDTKTKWSQFLIVKFQFETVNIPSKNESSPQVLQRSPIDDDSNCMFISRFEKVSHSQLLQFCCHRPKIKSQRACERASGCGREPHAHRARICRNILPKSIFQHVIKDVPDILFSLPTKDVRPSLS